MKYLALLAGLVFLMTAQQCRSGKTVSTTANYTETMNILQSTWLHSYEDDTDNSRAYRPNTYNFPPSRGRTGFAFEPGGKFIQYDIAPTDGLEEKQGNWQMLDAKTVSITFPEKANRSNYVMELISLDRDMLVVRMSER